MCLFSCQNENLEPILSLPSCYKIKAKIFSYRTDLALASSVVFFIGRKPNPKPSNVFNSLQECQHPSKPNS